jgi:hypothetical protein
VNIILSNISCTTSPWNIKQFITSSLYTVLQGREKKTAFARYISQTFFLYTFLVTGEKRPGSQYSYSFLMSGPRSAVTQPYAINFRIIAKFNILLITFKRLYSLYVPRVWTYRNSVVCDTRRLNVSYNIKEKIVTIYLNSINLQIFKWRN